MSIMAFKFWLDPTSNRQRQGESCTSSHLISSLNVLATLMSNEDSVALAWRYVSDSNVGCP